MAFIIKDRVKEGTTSTGTGAVSLGGAAATFDTFQSYMSNGDTTYYAIVHTTSGTDEWEVGLGTWNTGNTLTRTTVLAGSNGTSAVNFSAGTKDIFMTYPAAHAALAGDDVNFANITVTGTVDGRDVAADGSKLDTVEQYADVTDTVNVAAAGALMKSGGTMTGNLILNADPTTALGAATKEYVDTIAAAGIHYHTPVRVETPSALTATYDNGTSGVGATLTNSGTQAALVIDGVTVATNDRVLVYNQTNAAHNGIYTVTNTGSSSTNWVLTRATDADSYGVSDPDAFGEGDAFFVKEGDTGAGELYVMNTSGTITFGTTAINFTVIAETAVYSAGTGISLDGTTFSIGQDVGTTANVTFNQVTAAIIGNVTGNLTGDVTGNADTASALATARTIQLSGDVTGSATFDGSANINITAAVQDDSHAHVISNVDGLQAALDAKADDTTTITAGNGLTGGGSLGANRTLNVGAGGGITVSADAVAHADTSSQASVNNSGNTFIQDVTLDTYGHVTGLTSSTVTVGDATITVASGGGLTGSGDFTTNQGTNETITLSHADTSSQASVNNSGRTYIQDITLDTYGHITGITSATETVTNTNQLTTFQVEDGDGTEVTISHGKEWKFVEGGGVNIDWTDTTPGSDADPYDLTFTINTGVTAGSGLTGGGTLNVNRTISHADTSTQASVNNSNGTVIQDITLDGFGHITGLASVNLDGRYYTETEADSRFPNVQATFRSGAQNMDSFKTSGFHSLYNANATGHTNAPFQYGTMLSVGNTAASGGMAMQLAHERLNNGTYIRGMNDTNDTWYSWQRIFMDNYHPNADKWTTARTLSLSGDASGSVSWDGSANATLSVAVANDSHNHNHSDGDFTVNGHLSNSGGAKLEIMNGTDGGTSKGIYMWSTGDTNWVQYMSQSGAGKAPDGGTAPLPISGGTSHQYRFRAHNTSNHGFIFENSGDQTLMNLRGNDGNMYVRGQIYAGNSTSNKVWHQGNDGPGSGLNADTVDGIQGGSFLRSDADDTATGNITFTDNVRISAVSESWSEGLRIDQPTVGAWGGVRFARNGSTANSGNWALGFSNESNSDITFWSGTNAFKWRLDHSGHNTVYGSSRAPIFYDSNNTGFYVNPADGTTSARLNGDIYMTGGRIHVKRGTGLTTTIIDDDSSAGGRGQLLLDSHYSDLIIASRNSNANKHGSTLTFATQSTSTNDYAKWVIGQGQYQEGADHLSFAYGTNTSNPHSVLGTDNANFDFQIRNGGIAQAAGDMRAPIFYDSNNTGYYVNPASTSSMWNVNIRGDDSSTGTSNQLFLWGNGSTTTSAIGFKSNGGNFSNPTGSGDGYNTYLTMDTDGRGWVFRRGTGGTNFTAAYTSGWILNNGIWQAQASMRAPIFYDSNNTNYYVDPNSTSTIYDLNVINKRSDFGQSTNWDAVGFGNQTNLHMQGHNQFWIGAGNGTWFTGTANTKSQASGLAADASVAHDLLITTMPATSTYDRGVTFGVDSNGAGTAGWRLGKWHSGDAADSSKLVVDGGLFVKGGYTDEYDYYGNDYSAYYSHRGGAAFWGGDSGWNDPSGTFSTAIQIQSGNAGTNTRNPEIQFHQYGYGGVRFRYDGPSDVMHLESTATGRFDYFQIKTDHGYTQIGPMNSSWAHIYSDRSAFYFNKSVYVLGGSHMNQNDIRAGIFYDVNNTGYYIHADSTSNLNNLTVAGTLNANVAKDGIFWENNQTVTSNYTITNGKNAMSAGPITVNSGVTVTVGDGEAWTVV